MKPLMQAYSDTFLKLCEFFRSASENGNEVVCSKEIGLNKVLSHKSFRIAL